MAKKRGSIFKKRQEVQSDSPKPLFADEGVTTLSGIKDLVMEGRRKISKYEGIKDTPLPVGEISSDEVKDFLKEKIGNLTIEGTIHEMYLTIKSMESQLRKVLGINGSLEKDLKVTKESLLKTSKENERLLNRLKEIEEHGPLKTELERELNQLISDHNRKKEEIQDINRDKDKALLKLHGLHQDISTLEEEKEDAMKDASFLQSKLEDLARKLKDKEERVVELRGENLYMKEKIGKMEEEVSDLVEEKNATQFELKESKEAFDEIYDALIETKIKTKKFFYEELKGD